MWLMQLQKPYGMTEKIYMFTVQANPASNLPAWKNISKDN